MQKGEYPPVAAALDQAGETIAETDAQLDEIFALAVLESELLRNAILIWTLALAAVLLFAVYLLLPVLQVSVLRPAAILRAVGGVAALIAYEFLIRALVKRWLARKQSPPARYFYASSSIEVSLVSLTLLTTYWAFQNPVHVLSAPAFGFYFALIILTTLRLDRKHSIFTGCVAAFEYSLIAAYLLRTTPPAPHAEPLLWSPFYYGLMVMSLLIAALGAGLVAHEIRRRTYRVLSEREQRRRVIGMFGQFVAPTLVDEIVQRGADLNAQRRHVCIMFLDIRGFATFAESRDPADVVQYINTIFCFMAEIVERHHGMIHQFQGDGFLAFFGAPISHGNDSRNALDAAQALLRALDEAVSNGSIPPTKAGIGLHAGEVVACTIGSSIHREYALTGDVVNLASRIEGLNKVYGSRLLVSEAVLRDADPSAYSATDLGEVEIRGRSGSVHLYRLA